MTSSSLPAPRRVPGHRLFASVVLALLMPLGVQAHEYYGQGFTLVHPWAEPTPDGVAETPIYFSLEDIAAGDRLVRVNAPWAASGELRAADESLVPEVTGLPFAAGPARLFVAGQPHVQLKGLSSPLQLGRSYSMTFVFEKAGPINVMVSVGAH
ncbi:MAG: copper chaperone PCu(A)C [Burkholderiaceae bacterium]|nr:copper chaperone PCu(A)C [Burkholderiaceae bacterium]